MSIDAKTLLAEAETLRPALLTDRRTLHRNPEAGPVLPHTAAYVKQRLTELGYAPRDMAGGVTADIHFRVRRVYRYDNATVAVSDVRY